MCKKLFSGVVLVLGLALLMPSQVYAQKIAKVQIEGNKRIENETIISYMQLNEGDDFNQQSMNRALKSLFATGMFADVNISIQKDILTVKVAENPIVSAVYFEGNDKLENDQLKGEIQLAPRSVYTKAKVQKDVQRLLEVYSRSGRYGVTVEPKIIEREQNRVDVIYEIDEGPATYVRRIMFIGNDEMSDSKIKDALMTKEDVWYRFLSSTTTYDPDRMAYDKELIRRLYLRNGYIDVKVLSAIAELTPDKEGFFITFTISEGEKYKIGNLGIKSKLKNLDIAALEEQFNITAGDDYDSDRIDALIQQLSDEAGVLGHAFVEVVPMLNRRKDAEGNAVVDIIFNIEEGARIFINQINIHGNVRTKDEVIRREFRIAEGDAYNTAKIRRSKQRVEDLDFFSKVDVKTEPVPDSGDKTDVEVEVEEKSTGSLTFGVGWSTYDGALVQAGVTERNLLGRGQILSVNASLAQKRTEYDISFTEPYFLNRELMAGMDLFNISQDYQSSSSYDEKSVGGALRFGWRFNEELTESMKYTLRQDKISNVDKNASLYIKEQEGKTLTSMVGHSISYDTRDSVIRPTKGYILTLANDVAGLGGDNRFLRTDVYANYYLPIAKDWTLGFKVHGGYIFGFGQDVKINQRYFLGGNSLRGFEQGGASARAKQEGDALGGNWIATGTAELSFPLGLPSEFGIKGRLFSDIGVAGKPDDISSGKYEIDYSSKPRASVGFGIGWDSPMGPINVDIAYAIMKEKYDKTEVFRLNFGTGF